MNKVYESDNLDAMKNIDHTSIDLIATDPPFNTGKDFGEFKDIWGGLNQYIAFMKPRVVQMHHILKSTGSIYLHCDSKISHYLKVMLDDIFGIENFRNEIIWQRDAAGKGGKNRSKQWPRLQDVILFYSKTDRYNFKQLYKPLSKEQMAVYTRVDSNGRRFKAVSLGKYGEDKIEKMKQKDLVYVSKSGKQYKKYYLDEAKATIGSIWTDIPGFGIISQSKQRTGYPTQKPIKLYERIIEASSNEEDLVLDPFCGSGTTLVAAQNLNRRWIGIDKNKTAVTIASQRLLQVSSDNQLTLF